MAGVASTGAARSSLRYAEARARVLAAAHPLSAGEIPLAGARGRVLERPVHARHALPPFRNSAMDGVAVRSADLAGAAPDAPVTLAIVDTIPAGRPPRRALGAGEAARIMTGAMVPEGADAVVPVEALEDDGDARVRVARPAAPGEHVRDAGRDLGAGDLAVPAGRPLTAHDLGLLAALGEAHVRVVARPRVAVLSTGDELLEVEAPLTPGAIRDSNRLMLAELVEEAGGIVVEARRLPDDPAAVAHAIGEAFGRADVVLTIGGVSMGAFDPVKLALDRIGPVELWRVAMRPGQPQAFGAPGGRLFFGLPGNPASVACVFEALVRPALLRMQGSASLDRPRLAVRAARDIASRAGRTDFVRVTLAAKDGAWWATPAGEQVSGHIAPQSRAHALLVVPEAAERLAAGADAEALVLRWPGPDES